MKKDISYMIFQYGDIKMLNGDTRTTIFLTDKTMLKQKKDANVVNNVKTKKKREESPVPIKTQK